MEERIVFNRIKIVLVENRKSSQWLAKELGITPTSVSRWCTNVMQPTIKTLFEVADLLGVDVRTLLESTKEKEPKDINRL